MPLMFITSPLKALTEEKTHTPGVRLLQQDSVDNIVSPCDAEGYVIGSGDGRFPGGFHCDRYYEINK